MSCPDCNGPKPPYENPLGFTVAPTHLMVMEEEGNVKVWTNPVVDSVPFFELGTGIVWREANDVTLPLGGGGFLYRDPTTEITQWTGANMGDSYIMFTKPDQSFGGIAVPQVAPGTFLVLKAPETPSVFPTFVALPTPAPTPDSVVINMDEVSGENTNASTVNFRADRLILTDGTDSVIVTAINVSANLAAPIGIGGLDGGAENSDQFYYVYVMSDDGTNVGLMISQSQTAPTIGTTGYPFYARVGAFRNDGSGDIIPFMQRGRDVRIEQTQVSDAEVIPNAYAAMTTDLVPLDELIPPIAKSLAIAVSGATGTSELASNANSIGATFGVSTSVNVVERLLIDDPTAPEVFWKNSIASTADAWIFGYSY